MIVFLGLIALVLVIVSYLFFLKPSFATMDHSKKELVKIKEEIDKENADARKLRVLRNEQKQHQKHISELKQGLFHGLRHNRLIPFFTEIAAQYDFPVKPTYSYEKHEEVPTEECIEVHTRIQIPAYDYLKLGRFLKALECSNSGIRISNMTLNRVSSTAPNGMVDADFELQLLGFNEDSDPPRKWTAQIPEDSSIFDGRNPFGPPGPKKIANPEQRFIYAMKNLRINSKWKGNGLIVKNGISGREYEWMLDEYISLGGKKVKLIKFSVDLPKDYIIIERKDNNTSYRLTTEKENVLKVEILNPKRKGEVK